MIKFIEYLFIKKLFREHILGKALTLSKRKCVLEYCNSSQSALRVKLKV